jgi:hypothetical protein
MSKQRAEIGFGSSFETLDPDEWKPAAADAAASPKPPRDQIRKVARSAGFESREAPPAAITEQIPAAAAKPVRKRVPYTTGRNIQTNIKTRLQDDTEFKDISAAMKWPQGYTFQRAVEALKRELQASGQWPPSLGKTA